MPSHRLTKHARVLPMMKVMHRGESFHSLYKITPDCKITLRSSSPAGGVCQGCARSYARLRGPRAFGSVRVRRRRTGPSYLPTARAYHQGVQKSIGDNLIPDGWSLEKGLALIKKAGFDGVELWLGEKPWFKMDTSDAGVRELLRKVRDAGLTVIRCGELARLGRKSLGPRSASAGRRAAAHRAADRNGAAAGDRRHSGGRRGGNRIGTLQRSLPPLCRWPTVAGRPGRASQG